MAIKNLFARGIGFNAGDVGLIVTRGYEQGAATTPTTVTLDGACILTLIPDT